MICSGGSLASTEQPGLLIVRFLVRDSGGRAETAVPADRSDNVGLLSATD